MVIGLKKCCISDEIDEQEDGNVGSEYESMRSEYETREEL
jgi:hypothetical protein